MNRKTISEVLKEFPNESIFKSNNGDVYIVDDIGLSLQINKHFVPKSKFNSVSITGLKPHWQYDECEESAYNGSSGSEELVSLAEQIRSIRKDYPEVRKFKSEESGLSFSINLNLILIYNEESSQSIILTMEQAKYIFLPKIKVGVEFERGGI